MARLQITRRGCREIIALDETRAHGVMGVLGWIERDPEAGHALRGRLRGLRSLRVGSYRLIYRVDRLRRIATVLTVRHRATASESDLR